MPPPPPAVNLAEIQKAEEMRQRQLEVEESERRALVQAQMAELEAIQRRKQQAASWTDKYYYYQSTTTNTATTLQQRQ